jgi:WhiB family transcriptional regulator, redox-sensing transcriptional regulator
MTNSAMSQWAWRAACSDDLLFMKEPGLVTDRELETARGICAGCLVRAECLADAEADPDAWGIRGGRTQAERNGTRESIARAEWTHDDDEIIRANPHLTAATLATELGRTTSAVRQRRNRLARGALLPEEADR